MAEAQPAAPHSKLPALPALVEAMMHPGFYPERPALVDLIQTHISYVFLAGAFVYKLKKAVRFSFIDAADVACRRHLCEDEIRLNRRLAPDVYLGMLPIFRDGAEFRLGGDSSARGEHDEVVDYVIKMRRLPAECMLDRMLARREVDHSTIRALAAVVSKFFATASTAHAGKYGAASALWHRIVGEIMEVEPLVGLTLSAEEFRIIQDFLRGFISTHWRMLNARAAAGNVREGHGDLRCEHICVEGDKISIFDCVEFSERLRTCDIASEVAFLAMDLDRLGAPDLADDLVGVIVDSTDDDELPLLMPFYKCYRAVIRGVVESLRSRQSQVDASARESAITLAHRYFALACEYAQRAAPAIIVVCGLSGSGKSTVARALQNRFGFRIVSSDRTRKNLSSIPIETNSADAYRSGIYADAVTQATYAAMLDDARHMLIEATGAILDATYQDPSHRKAVLELASQMKAPVLFIECRAEDSEIRRRLIEREKRGHNPSDADVSVYLRQVQDFVPLSEIPGANHLMVDTWRPLRAIVSDAERALAGRQRQLQSP
jgi:aminoglycoside phosphotransferase family enzyme/predicted kinase